MAETVTTTTVACDHCKADLTDAGGMPSYRIVLAAERIKNSGSIIYDVLVYPPVDSTKHFCNLPCLREWLSKQKKD